MNDTCRLCHREADYASAYCRLHGAPQGRREDLLKHIRGVESPLEWGRQANLAKDAGFTLEEIIQESHLPRSVVLDRMEAAKEHALQVAMAEEHGKVIGKAEEAQDHNDRNIRELYMKGKIPCPGCGELRDESVIKDGHCHTCQGKEIKVVVHGGDFKVFEKAILKQTKGPKERGLTLCLEPGCKVWITGVPKKNRAFLVEREHFCKKHAKFIDVDGHEKPRGYDSYPLRDRDGDPIWVGARFQVTKMHDLEMGHLLNCISLLERAAEKREQYTGKPKSEGLKELPKHAMLIAELKQRDACKLCKGGLVLLDVRVIRDGEPTSEAQVGYCGCKLGQERKATDAIAEQSNGKSKAAILVLVMAFVTALLNAPAASTHVMEFLHGVHERLKAMGIL